MVNCSITFTEPIFSDAADIVARQSSSIRCSACSWDRPGAFRQALVLFRRGAASDGAGERPDGDNVVAQPHRDRARTHDRKSP